MYLSFRIWLLSISFRFFDLFSKRIAIWYFQFKIRFSPHNWIFYFWYFRIHILTPLVFMFGLCCTRICPYCGYCAYWNFLKKGEFMYLCKLERTEGDIEWRGLLTVPVPRNRGRGWGGRFPNTSMVFGKGESFYKRFNGFRGRGELFQTVQWSLGTGKGRNIRGQKGTFPDYNNFPVMKRGQSFSLGFQKFFSITRTIFSHSRSEQFW